MRDNLENLVILFAVVAAIATVGWFGYRSVAGWLGEESAPVAPATSGPVEPERTEPPIVDAEEDAPETEEDTPYGADAPVDAGNEAASETVSPAREPTDVVEPPLDDGATVHERVAPSTVVVESANSGRALGAGWVIAPGVVVTSSSVADRASGAAVRPVETGAGVAVARVVRTDPSRGLALLDVPGLDAPPLDVAAAAPELGARVHALAEGPTGASFAEGVVTSLRVVGGARAFGMSVPVPATLEGGPVADADGRATGVAVRRLGEEGIEEIVVAAPAVADLLEGRIARVPTPTRAPPPPRPEPTSPPPPPPRRPEPRREARPEPAAGPAERPELDVYERRFSPRDFLVDSATKLHERPDASSHVISRLRPGTVVTAVGETEGWLRIRSSTGARDGYLPRAAVRPLAR